MAGKGDTSPSTEHRRLLDRIFAFYRRPTKYKLAARTIGVSILLGASAGFAIDVVDKSSKVGVWLGFDRCRMTDSETLEPSASLPKRNCLPGHVTFITWCDTTPYEASSVVDCPNRSLQVDSADQGRQVVWGEREIVKRERGQHVWNAETPQHQWIAIDGAQSYPKWAAVGNNFIKNENIMRNPETGFILRRQDISCENGVQSIMELFIVPDEVESQHARLDVGPGIYNRVLRVPCNTPIPNALIPGAPFVGSLNLLNVKRD